MAATITCLVKNAQLSDSEADVLTVDTSHRSQVFQILLHNTNQSATAEAVVIKIVPSGDTSGDQHIIWKESLAANVTSCTPAGFVLSAGDKIRAYTTTASKVNIRIDGTDEN